MLYLCYIKATQSDMLLTEYVLRWSKYTFNIHTDAQGKSVPNVIFHHLDGKNLKLNTWFSTFYLLSVNILTFMMAKE